MKLFIQIISLFSMLFVIIACGTESTLLSALPSSQEENVKNGIKYSESEDGFTNTNEPSDPNNKPFVASETSCSKLTHKSIIEEVDYLANQVFEVSNPIESFTSTFAPGKIPGTGNCMVTYTVNLEIGKSYFVDLIIYADDTQKEIVLWGSAGIDKVTSIKNSITLYLFKKKEVLGKILEFDPVYMEEFKKPEVTKTECKVEKKYIDDGYFYRGRFYHNYYYAGINCSIDYKPGSSSIKSIKEEIVICSKLSKQNTNKCIAVQPFGVSNSNNPFGNSSQSITYSVEFNVTKYVNPENNYTLKVTIKTEDGKSYLHEELLALVQ